LSEIDAKKIGVEDNDWIELYNVNGTIAARAVVSQKSNSTPLVGDYHYYHQ
jgi:nitrate reductase alpha subunit